MGKAGRSVDYSASTRHSSLSTRVVSLWTLITLGLALGAMPAYYDGIYQSWRENNSRPLQKAEGPGQLGPPCIIDNSSRLHFLSSQYCMMRRVVVGAQLLAE